MDIQTILGNIDSDKRISHATTLPCNAGSAEAALATVGAWGMKRAGVELSLALAAQGIYDLAAHLGCLFFVRCAHYEKAPQVLFIS